MEKCEKETILLFNKADSDDGYFTISTSIKSHYERIISRIGSCNIINSRVQKDCNGQEVFWDLKIPIEYYSLVTFGLKKPVKTVDFQARRESLRIARKAKANKRYNKKILYN